MVQTCVAYNCNNRSKKNSGISFYRFPQDPELQKKWVIATKRKNFTPSIHSRICSEHFSQDQFQIRPNCNFKLLNPGAVPTLFDFSSHLASPPPKKRRPLIKKQATVQESPSNTVCLSPIETATQTPSTSADRCEITNAVLEQKRILTMDNPLGNDTIIPESSAILPDSGTIEIKQEKEEYFEFIEEETSSSNEKSLEGDVSNSAIKEESSRFDNDESQEPGMVEFISVKTEVMEDEQSEHTEVDPDPLALYPTVHIKVESNYTEEENTIADALPSTSRGVGSEASNYGKKQYIGLDSECSSPRLDILKIDIGLRTSEPSDETDFLCVQLSDRKGKIKSLAKEKPFKCAKCEYSSAQLASLKKHLKKHDGKNIYKCKQCELTCANSSSLKIHTRIHTKEKPFKCTKCELCFSQLGSLKRHFKGHTGAKPFTCTLCGCSFTQLSSFRRHFKRHSGEKPFKCKECIYSSFEASDLKLHMKRHTRENPFKCDKCDYSCDKLRRLESHLRKHIGKNPYKCKECEYSGAHPSTLKRHMRIHTKEKPFKCTHCGYSFSELSNLKTHFKRHTGEKTFKCNECEYSCVTASNLKTHLIVHDREKSYKCDDCDYSGRLKTHVMSHT